MSQLAREVGLSRPLVHVHLQRFEAAGLVTGRLELSDDGKAMKFFEVSPFAIHLTPELVVDAARTLDAVRESTNTPERKETIKLVDELTAVQQETTAELQKANDALAQLRGQIAELEQGIREVDRVLKAVE